MSTSNTKSTKRRLYRHPCRNYWVFFDKIAFCLIHPHEKFWTWIHWNKRFNRLKIGDRLEWQFGKLPEWVYQK